MRSDVELRDGVVDDAIDIAAYYHRCWIPASESLLDPGVAERLESSMWLDLFRDRLMPDSPMRTTVATCNGVVIGHVNVEGNHLVHLFVDPDHQGSGIGRHLLGVGEQLIAAGGHTDAELHTRVGNERAIGLYESAGWVLTDRLIHSVDEGIEYDEHVMVKRFGSSAR